MLVKIYMGLEKEIMEVVLDEYFQRNTEKRNRKKRATLDESIEATRMALDEKGYPFFDFSLEKESDKRAIESLSELFIGADNPWKNIETVDGLYISKKEENSTEQLRKIKLAWSENAIRSAFYRDEKWESSWPEIPEGNGNLGFVLFVQKKNDQKGI